MSCNSFGECDAERAVARHGWESIEEEERDGSSGSNLPAHAKLPRVAFWLSSRSSLRPCRNSRVSPVRLCLFVIGTLFALLQSSVAFHDSWWFVSRLSYQPLPSRTPLSNLQHALEQPPSRAVLCCVQASNATLLCLQSCIDATAYILPFILTCPFSFCTGAVS